MMIQVTSDDKWRTKCFEWIKPKAHIHSNEDKYSFLGIIEDDEILGVILFSDYDGNNIFVHTALDTPRACNRRVIRLMFDYIFNQANCSRATATCDNNYDRIKKLIEGLGFEKEGVLKRMMQIENKYVDCAVYGLLKENCKWV
tara:strand:- start:123 stop:551 length:429 start_codon:yes stop_codon:yes gene_type:complete